MASIEQRFQAAVNVIKGLPKNGPYQPSTTMMLKFYGYYKQATEGPCNVKKPAFWDVVGKAKWDAWNGNRHLSKQQAMQKYVDDLREIIETMSFTENVQNFVGSLSGLDNINLDELDMIAPGMREIAESHPNSPFNSRSHSPQHGAVAAGLTASAGDCIKAEELHRVPSTNGHVHFENNNNNTDANNMNSADASNATLRSAPPSAPSSMAAASNVDQSDDEYGDPIDIQHDLIEVVEQNSAILKQIQSAVQRMNGDVNALHQRTLHMEKVVEDMRTAMQKSRSCRGGSSSSYRPKWWPLSDISPMWFVVLLLWPFVVKRVSSMLAHKSTTRK